MARAETIPAHIRTLPEAVAHHARMAPRAAAVTGYGEALDHARLDAMADRVAAALAAYALRPGEPVLLHGETTGWSVASALGIMRAGGFVVPVGRDDPAARVRLIAEDCAARLGLSSQPADCPPGVVEHLLDPADPALPQAAPEPGGGPDPDDLAYALFTSGSTGRPKGVMIEHRNLMHYVRAAADRYRIDGRVPPLPALTPLSFDASVLQVYAPLARGADVWLVPPPVREDPAALLAVLAGRPGAGLHCVPSLWAEVLREVRSAPGSRAPLRALLLGGEVVPPQLWEETGRALPDTALANVYGPTEATVQATGDWQRPGEVRAGQQPPHTGTALPGVGISVRSPEGIPLGPGEHGEIHIFGEGVGRGYLGRPELTAERFREEPGTGRVFRTGDEGYLDAAGRLTVLGRLDEQVKVRGYRVEPAETEAGLRSAPGVRDAAVTVLDPHTSAARLVAAVTPADGVDTGELDEAELRAHCRRQLAPYLVPARIRVLPALPRTANGKTDRGAIRRLFARTPAAPAPEAAPAGTERERLRRLWCALLQLEEVDDGDDFFDLGGHSLLATRLIGRTRKELGRPVPLRTIFEQRTFDAFARAVGADRTAGRDAAPGSLEPAPVPDDIPVPLTLQQRSLWALYRAAPELPSAHVLLPLELQGPVTRELIDAALRALVGYHPALRGVIQEGDEPTVRPLPDPCPPLVETDLRGVTDTEGSLRRHARSLYRRPFRLAEEMPLRAAWLRTAGDRSVLLLCLHHLACDGASLRILAADLHALLNGAAPLRSAQPRLGHREYAVWQRRRWEAGELAPALAHWVTHLKDGREELVWPSPAVPPAERTYRSRVLDARPAPGMAPALHKSAVTHSATEFTLLAAALGLAVREVTGVRELALGMLSDGRSRAEFEDAVGLFSSTLAVRLPVGERDPARLIPAVGDAVLRAQTHRDVPLDVAAEHVSKAPAALQPFDVGLSVDWAAREEDAGPQARVRVRTMAPEAADIPTGAGTASCALTVFARRDGDDLRLSAEYAVDLLDEATVRRVLEGVLGTLEDWTGAAAAGTPARG
ncbi:AMP-binding protein [Streptomyces albus]|uniref:AMP-binding protein n=1 Tax=Streptomyces albus TaxID=1888 RepID=UPI0033C7C73E